MRRGRDSVRNGWPCANWPTRVPATKILAARLAQVTPPPLALCACSIWDAEPARTFATCPRHLGGDQEWLLVDNDSHAVRADSRRLSLQRHHAQPRSGHRPRRSRIRAGCAGDGASALLDLVSEKWLERLVDRCRHGSCTALFALTYDGSIEFRPRTRMTRRCVVW